MFPGLQYPISRNPENSLPWLHIVGDRTYAIEHGNGFLVMDPGYDCKNFTLADIRRRDNCTLSKLLDLVEKKSKPVTHLFLSHFHQDHSDNLNAFLTMRLNHELFPFIMVAHEKSHIPALMKSSGIPAISVTGDVTLPLSAGPVDILCTPGHSSGMDDISIFFPGKRALFVGDMIQPQGKSYHECDFDTPFSNHSHGFTALKSLVKMEKINFTNILMGHDGTVFNRIEGLQAIDITCKVLRRTLELSEKLVSENPGKDEETYVEWIHDTIAWERGVPKHVTASRKVTGHSGEVPSKHPKSFYSLYDTPSIWCFVKQILNGRTGE
ncbi:MAG: hypothetical protein CVV64_04945 [Candidatus Wallbacteria bacterium HGW-Wallbacteria-1]|uniref:Metallo-beta-lactamase domain-containing protein n=1 Tax=Candidatus Wallbacteria bacterium HGW-Wallbacteria-1 TaxID=2013854 RepID=A0A2N1PS05_9BACT|nr:MAG: hypothetical protein CVV64_04945 [Candidatus Wallbacteria bacterium HGW-Wallbacteria-1]